MDAQLEDFRPGLEPDYSDDDRDPIVEAAKACVEHHMGGPIFSAVERRNLAYELDREPTDKEFDTFWLLVGLELSTKLCECQGLGISLDGDGACGCQGTKLITGDYPAADCRKCRAHWVEGVVSPAWVEHHVKGCNGEVA